MAHFGPFGMLYSVTDPKTVGADSELVVMEDFVGWQGPCKKARS